MSNSKTLSWNDRFALIDHFKPTDEDICKVFGVTTSELDTARNLRKTGAIVPTPNIDVNSYTKLFGNIKSTQKRSSGATTVKKTSTNQEKPLTATKPIKPPKKRGRKGDNIVKAFKAIPSTPTPVQEFAKNNGVSVAVLRQSKRFDTTGTSGKVYVKKDKNTKTLMIWRESQ